ncbi:TetR/AcrR family transcriptional regulator [Rhodococcus sp. IEGM 1379]|uniref:TetR/AcrR family transcriptional regulator n=1 Tax=Rhodococcus sp. IEGM 1379 TaxID=3047086 RepID=UPI0024B73B35|nr:TetR/AcrR family transcriptional regulator [Rhodococcus sp. IEGM 1379]MDI9914041.1 TetR/AcrR family transcriptional regulator [Rhodococcus sp. IEGM 1379]
MSYVAALPPKRVTKRRGQTRQRLLDAAAEVFAAEGFGRATVEQICERGGYSRGAFYSNFGSLDELFFAMWEQRSAAMLADLKKASAAITAGSLDITSAVARIVEVVPVDPQWYRINAEFTAHALRNDALRTALADREDAILQTLLPIVESALHDIGRKVVGDPTALGRALVAIHDGTSVQCLVDTDTGAAFTLRRDIFTRILLSYSASIESNQPEEELL